MRQAEPIHPALLDALLIFYDEEATVREYTETQSESGEPIKTWQDKAGLEALECRVFGKLQMVAGPDGDMIMASHRVALRGYYEAIIPGMRVIVGSSTYDILGVEHDSQQEATTLVVQMLPA